VSTIRERQDAFAFWLADYFPGVYRFLDRIASAIARVLRGGRVLLLALTVAALALCLLLLSASPALADYSDHGEPQTSTVASTHPQTYTGGGGELVRTGSDLGGLVLAGGVCFGIGFAAVLLASRKRTGVRHG
jgi:hypothetical protein